MADPNDDPLARAIAGALRAAIHAHGPITLEHIGSATKRILGSLRNARGGLGRLLGLRRWADAGEGEGPADVGARGGAAAWKGVSKAERSAEMKRRAAKRKPKDGGKP